MNFKSFRLRNFLRQWFDKVLRFRGGTVFNPPDSTIRPALFGILKKHALFWTLIFVLPPTSSWDSFILAQSQDSKHLPKEELKEVLRNSSFSKSAVSQVWPSNWSTGDFLFHSTVHESILRKHIDRLVLLPKEIEKSLGIELRECSIRVVVLSNAHEYDRYVSLHFPKAPKRRALFLQHRGPGLVLTYFHEDWIEDARHECTHAILHANGIRLPVWLDEGLAEYFEREQIDRRIHPVHFPAVVSQLRYGQVVDLEEFEQQDHVLDSKSYRDAWSVVAFLLHLNDESRQALQSFVQDRKTGAAAGLLSRRLSSDMRRHWRDRYVAFFKDSEPGDETVGEASLTRNIHLQSRSRVE
jgi:hypothetical protein